jgi:HEAT repeat protein
MELAQEAAKVLPQDDPRSTAELIRFALAESNADRRWDDVTPLHWRHDEDSLEQAAALCRGTAARERALGADIIAQFGIGRDVFHDERVTLLLDLLTDHRATVLAAAATGFGHLKDSRAATPLAVLRNHPSRRVRFGVTFGLISFEEPVAIEALIELSHDPDRHVRDWATFGLGTMIESDTPEIRAALVERLDDTDGDTAAEAMAGLAHRKDPRATEPVLKALTAEWVGSLVIEAASEIGDRRFYPYLLQIKRSNPSDRSLDEAIERCRPHT